MTRPKLSAKQKAEVRKLYASTIDLPPKTLVPNPKRWSYERLGQRYGVSRETIRRALAEETPTNDR